MASPIREKHANRRIRLLLVVFMLVFAAMFARAVLAPGRPGGAPLAASRGASTSRRRRSRPGAARSSTAPASSSRSASRRRRSTPTRSRCTTRAAIALAAHELLGVNGNVLYPELVNKKSQFVYVARFADPAKAALFLKKGFAGIASYPEELRTYPQDGVAAQVLGFAGIDQHGPRRARAAVRPQARRAARQADDRPRPDRPRDRRDQLAAGAGGLERLHHARPHDPGAGREGAARRRSPSGARRTRPRSCSTRRPARSSRWPRRRATTRTTPRTSPATRRRSCATAPSPTPTSRARPSSS